MKLTRIILVASLMLATSVANSAQLISAKEAALPAASGTLATRGISRGPSVKMVSPEADTPVASPIDFKVNFEARGEGKIDPSSVKVVYMKSPFVDLTPRLKGAISAQGIDFAKADVPPGAHTIRVTVKDNDGRETNSVFTLNVIK
ncbi:hypothetical protein CBI30_04235 [Polynucleobacter aenigmaticus]|jgi:hypothetical protein|uniref:Uncharacterized protein n=1 Tax=Polynucleobacter aenigmaticus TaxID=1743164 RepID=A0A254PZQ4_9BURK|nr:hypothetical protein [Polynucleobacter aenigmaticus]OWS72050.1 hypothetical protein CBI30_04235 [Polynucleobacter aenigmaticus]